LFPGARVIERRVEPAELGIGAVHHRRHLRAVTHVAPDGYCFVTGGYQLLSFGLYQVLSDIGQHDRGACFGERLGCREPHA